MVVGFGYILSPVKIHKIHKIHTLAAVYEFLIELYWNP